MELADIVCALLAMIIWLGIVVCVTAALVARGPPTHPHQPQRFAAQSPLCVQVRDRSVIFEQSFGLLPSKLNCSSTWGRDEYKRVVPADKQQISNYDSITCGIIVRTYTWPFFRVYSSWMHYLQVKGQAKEFPLKVQTKVNQQLICCFAVVRLRNSKDNAHATFLLG